LLPKLTIVVIGQQVLLPSAIEKGSRLASETFNDVAIVDTAGATFLLIGGTNPGQFNHHLMSQIADNPVMVEV